MGYSSDTSSSSSGSSPRGIDIVEQYSDVEDGVQSRRRAAEVSAKYHAESASDSANESSSDNESEDEEGEQMTADVDAAILTTLAKIKRKDESIYETGKRVFDEERKVASSSKLLPRALSKGTRSKDKVTLKSYQRARIQELMDKSDDPAKALADALAVQPKRGEYGYEGGNSDAYAHLPYTQQQERVRLDALKAFQSAGIAEDDDVEDFLVSKAGRNDGNQSDGDEAHDYEQYLLNAVGGEKEHLRNLLTSQEDVTTAESSSAPHQVLTQEGKGSKGKKGKKDEDEDFLVNYLLNRGWVDNPGAAPKISSNAEIGNDAGSDSDTSFDSKADAYETAYNFRFQELEEGETNPQIQSYARQIEGSVRRKEEKRKREREERARRKQAEKEDKKRQIDVLRDAKRKSIVDKLKALREATGSTAVDFEGLDLEGDFDPDEHDRLMAQAFNEDYYGEDDDQKPSWSDDGSDFGDVPHDEGEDEEETGREHVAEAEGKKAKGKKAQKTKVSAIDDVRIEMDADFVDAENDNNGQAGKKLSKAEKKKLKKRERAKAKKAEETGVAAQGSKEADGVAQDEMDADAAGQIEELKALDPRRRRQKVDEMLDEYYDLGYEDVIGDQPTRFKYTPVPKSDFGMTAEEILLADDAELNKIVSLKRLQPYRRGRTKPSDLNSRLKDFRGKIKRQDESSPGNAEQQQSKRPGKRERKRKAKAREFAATQDGQDGGSAPDVSATANGTATTAEQKTKKRKSHVEAQGQTGQNSMAASFEVTKKHKKEKKEKSSANIAA